MSQQLYPNLVTRIKALMADIVVLLILMVCITYVFANFESVPDNGRMIAFIFIFYLYDPILTSLSGGTIGHHLLGLRVKREDGSGKNLLLYMAILRFVIKSLLGWLSLLTVTGNDKKRAIHDYIGQSVVVYSSYKAFGSAVTPPVQ